MVRPNAVLLGASALHGAMVVVVPSPLLVALGFWWGANTVGHWVIHHPFFRDRTRNAAYSLYLSLVFGIPQDLWRQRHLAHHAGRKPAIRWTRELLIELLTLCVMAATLVVMAPERLILVLLPGIVLGLSLCAIHGHFEHSRGTVSHYGTLYNTLFFNDGYHVEHHLRPELRYQDLPGVGVKGAPSSRWPAVLRWLENVVPRGLNSLEHGLTRFAPVRRLLLATHRAALVRLLPPDPQHVVIVGGGLFPRTALLIATLRPSARITILERDQAHLNAAARWLPEGVQRHLGEFPRDTPDQADVVIVPLAYVGDKDALYHAPAKCLLIHDWWWRARGTASASIPLLLKRLNRVVPQ